MIKFLKNLRAAFFQWLSTGLFLLLIISCGSYTISSYHPKIKSLLAITETGDTVSVSMREFERQKYDTYTRFNFNNRWYWNNWHYDFNLGWNQWGYAYPNQYWWHNNLRYTNPSRDYRAPNRPKTQPRTRPRYTPPRTTPKLREPIERTRVNTPRRSNNQYTPRNTPPPSPRTRTTPNVQTRTNISRSSTGGRRNKQ